MGQTKKNPATPFLRYSPNGRLFAIWTEDDDSATSQQTQAGTHQHHSGKMAPSPMRDALLASSADGGKTWTSPKQVNRSVEAIQGEENGPKVAFGAGDKAYAVWSIPGDKGDKTRANIRFAMADGKGGFTPAKTLNEVKDAGRFPIIEFSPAIQATRRFPSKDGGQSWSPGSASEPCQGQRQPARLALLRKQLHVAWTETAVEDSRAVLRSATVAK
ncbi:MAG: hypothetical protein GEU77_16000 [Deltaproteobacteria bacterium]|nr:hypothetical protein [Deltaproteobacteria bacterium]